MFCGQKFKCSSPYAIKYKFHRRYFSVFCVFSLFLIEHVPCSCDKLVYNLYIVFEQLHLLCFCYVVAKKLLWAKNDTVLVFYFFFPYHLSMIVFCNSRMLSTVLNGLSLSTSSNHWQKKYNLFYGASSEVCDLSSIVKGTPEAQGTPGASPSA